jgi:hypothetical protein
MRFLVTVMAYFDRVVEVEAESEEEARMIAESGDHDGVRRNWRYVGEPDAIDVKLEG